MCVRGRFETVRQRAAAVRRKRLDELQLARDNGAAIEDEVTAVGLCGVQSAWYGVVWRGVRGGVEMRLWHCLLYTSDAADE